MSAQSGGEFALRAPGATAADLAVRVRRTASEVPGLGVDVAATLSWVRATGQRAKSIVDLDHASRWELLAAAADADVAAARALEPHLDALTILGEAPRADAADPPGADDPGLWGVFAAEGEGPRVTATRDGDRWTLSGVKPWCSLAAHLDRALVTAWIDDTRRGLFAVELRGPGVHPHDGPWVARGLAAIVSAPVTFDRAPATIVGEPGWYTSRPGFAWGGVGVAAVWWGGAAPLVAALADAARRAGADQLAAVYLGTADASWWAARTVLTDAALRADADEAPALTAPRARAVVVASVEHIIRTAERALGPVPLTTDERYARRVNDLGVYVRQDHAERDLGRLGRKLVR